MDTVRPSSPRLTDLIAYDAVTLKADVILSANENPYNLPESIRKTLAKKMATFDFNRYPDPTARNLRSLIADANGLDVENVLIGNGGDEMLFNLFLAWGGAGRKFLNVPPTFEVYAINSRLTGTEIVEVPRLDDFSIDEDAVIARVSEGDIDIVVIASPNNPTGSLADEEFLARLLESTDALVMVDEAYFEFSRQTMRPYMMAHKNLLILRTFSKAFSLAGMRVGYILAHESVVKEFLKVRQPYSVDSYSQFVAEEVYSNRAQFEKAIEKLVGFRDRLVESLSEVEGVEVFPSDSNYILFRVDDAGEIWQRLFDEYSILIRNCSKSPYLENCLRVSVGSPEENLRFLQALKSILSERRA